MPLAEKALIAELRRIVSRPKNPAIPTPLGDDCAVLRLSPAGAHTEDTLVTTDFSLEGIHFQRKWHSPESIGHRCLARGLSDIAAMGGKPIAAFLSLALPPDLSQAWVRSFMRGLLALAEKYSVTLAGGDTAQSPAGILADIVVVGVVPRGKAVLRSGARPGDLIYVSGELGASASAVARMQEYPGQKLRPRDNPRHFFPDPRILLGRALRGKNLPSAMIDISDGLSTDLAHLCEESGVGAKILSERIPVAATGKPLCKPKIEFALHGGEDYELLFTAHEDKRVPQRLAGIPVTPIGHITRGTDMLLTDRTGVSRPFKEQGWEYFRKGRTPPAQD